MKTADNKICLFKRSSARWGLVSCLILIQIFFFQNCGKISPVSSDRQQNLGEIQVLGLTQPRALKFGSPQFQNFEEPEKGSSFELNLDNGDLEDVDSGTGYCVADDLLESLKALFAENQICHFSGNQDPQIHCTAIFKPAYAVIIDALGAETFLGQRTSGCSETINFCEDTNQERQKFLLELMEQAVNESPEGSC